MTCDIIDFLNTQDTSLLPIEELSFFLKQHKCYYLLTKLSNNEYSNLTNKIAIKIRYDECKLILEKATFPYAIIKGAPLSYAMYKDPCLRQSGDVDILISANNLEELKRLLVNNGFIQGRITSTGIKPFSREEKIYYSMNTHQVAPFIKSTGNKILPYISVDINLDIMWGEYPKQTDMSFVLEHLEKFQLFKYEFYKLCPEMEFIALCLHHYKDMNSIYLLTKGSLCLGLFCEINDYMCNVPMDLDKLQKICDRLEIGKYVYACIKQTCVIFNNSYANKYLTFFKRYEDIFLDNTFGLSDMERKNWKISLIERLFHLDLRQYIYEMLSKDEIDKINLNNRMI